MDIIHSTTKELLTVISQSSIAQLIHQYLKVGNNANGNINKLKEMRVRDIKKWLPEEVVSVSDQDSLITAFRRMVDKVIYIYLPIR